MAFVNLQPGDRVELVENYGTRKIGEQGVITRRYFGCDSYLVDIRMDKQNNYGAYNMECYERRVKRVVQAPAPKAPLPDAIYMVSQAADRIFPRRTYDTILKSLMEEVGELSTEIAIKQGTKKRVASVDGVKGEAVDVFIVAVDMLRNAFGDKLHTSEFTDAVRNKLNKWEGV